MNVVCIKPVCNKLFYNSPVWMWSVLNLFFNKLFYNSPVWMWSVLNLFILNCFIIVLYGCSLY